MTGKAATVTVLLLGLAGALVAARPRKAPYGVDDEFEMTVRARYSAEEGGEVVYSPPRDDRDTPRGVAREVFRLDAGAYFNVYGDLKHDQTLIVGVDVASRDGDVVTYRLRIVAPAAHMLVPADGEELEAGHATSMGGHDEPGRVPEGVLRKMPPPADDDGDE